MSSVHIPRVLTNRGKTSLEIEREKFETSQTTSIQKAINSNETPVKEKHARVAIMGSHQTHSGHMFWTVITRHVQLQAHPIICWKFCHVLHKFLRDGHPQVVKDSQKYCSYITDLGKLWGHLKEGYGRLIAYYTKLLVQKLTFHRKNPEFPGNLMLGEGQLDKICNHDVNSYFELSVDLLDYMDGILGLQNCVFGSLDMSRSNSMTQSGQCRLAPLIQCIQDSCHLYDYLVKLLFKLHSSLPPDTLGGHRDRFHGQYKKLKKFYYNSCNLQYFKNLIKVPSLPDNPPNFLRASDISTHVTPVAVVPEPEPIEEDTMETASVASSEPEVALVQFEDAPTQQNGAQYHPPVPDEKDMLISSLMHEINMLKQELARVKAEDQMMIESLKNRLRELEIELSEYRQIAESTQVENESLRQSLKDGETNQDAASRLMMIEKIAKANDDKFKKMKDIYGKLREEHVQLLRTHADVNKQLSTERKLKDEIEERERDLAQTLQELEGEKFRVESTLQMTSSDSAHKLTEADDRQRELEQQKQALEEQLKLLDEAKAGLEASLSQCQSDIESLQRDLTQSAEDRKCSEDAQNRRLMDHRLKMLVMAAEEGSEIIKESMEQAENPYHTTVTCTAEYLKDRAEPVLASLGKLKEACGQYQTDPAAVGDAIKAICDFSHRMGDVIVNGFATAQAAPVEDGEELATQCRNAGEEALNLMKLIREANLEGVGSQTEQVEEVVRRILAQAEALLPKVEDIEAEKMGDLIDQEMQQTTEAIEEAAKRIADMLAQSREAHSGIQLEVNERILDSCNALMLAIKVLVIKSKSLQREITEMHRGASSNKDFYKKHHRWTEGLISAAKAVGWGANVLLTAADKVVKGEGKLEELIVCSQEIAASTTQLVVASKVKAQSGSVALMELGVASKGVTNATGKVVASAKSAAQMIDDMDTLDFSKLTLHQAKRLEMESQVRVIELESNLDRERVKLSDLRKTHYRLAGESEGWDQEDIDEEEDGMADSQA